VSERGPDPYGAHRFRVVCDALPGLGFSEVRGLSVRVETAGTEEEEMADDDRDRDRPRRWWERGGWPGRRPVPVPRREARSPPLVLRRGVTDDDALWRWLRDWLDGEVTPQDVRVCLLDDAGDPVRGWVCRGARPVRWQGPDLDAGRAAVATETLELVHDRLEALDDPTDCTEEEV
jgi:phage tail-like protein